MFYTIHTMFGRWKVFAIGHTDGDSLWLATFRHREHAEAFIATFISHT